jgi:hypothetical protein
MTAGYWFLLGLGVVVALILWDAYMLRGEYRPLSRGKPDNLNDRRAPLGQEAIDRDAFAVKTAQNAALATSSEATSGMHSRAALMAVPPRKVATDRDGERKGSE